MPRRTQLSNAFALLVLSAVALPGCLFGGEDDDAIGSNSQGLEFDDLQAIVLPSTSPAAGGALSRGIEENLDRRTEGPGRYELMGLMNNVPVGGRAYSYIMPVAPLQYLDLRVTGCSADGTTADPAGPHPRHRPPADLPALTAGAASRVAHAEMAPRSPGLFAGAAWIRRPATLRV